MSKLRLERGHVRHRLIHELARGEKTRAQLAEEYGVAGSSITEFAQRHATQIAEVQADLENEFAGLWVAEKARRLASYEADIDRFDSALERSDTPPQAFGALARAKQTALRQVAEELGQIPSKVNLSVEPVTVKYEVVGVETEELE